ncbi:MAG TPA: hypothetical protein PKD55_01430, partial [Bellilinea sp.]|nr:hypothetical protein [Bellilinea sp.]
MAKKTKPTTKPNDYDAPVNLDGDPIEARTTADGHFRPMLNRRERRVLKQKAQTREVIKLLLDGMDMPAIAEKLGIDLWELSYSMINLSGDEAREYIYNRTIDLILDVDRGRTRDEICRIVGITKSQLNTMISSDEFKVLYAEKFIKVRSDPNIELVRQRVIEDLL